MATAAKSTEHEMAIYDKINSAVPKILKSMRNIHQRLSKKDVFHTYSNLAAEIYACCCNGFGELIDNECQFKVCKPTWLCITNPFSASSFIEMRSHYFRAAMYCILDSVCEISEAEPNVTSQLEFLAKGAVTFHRCARYLANEPAGKIRRAGQDITQPAEAWCSGAIMDYVEMGPWL
jgi:hypothetical protein